MKKHLLIPLLLASLLLPGAQAQMTLDDYLKTLPELDADAKSSNRAQFAGRRTVEISYKYERSLKTPDNSIPGNFAPAKYLKSITIPGGGPKGYAWEQFLRDPQGKPILIAYTDNAGNLMRGPHVWSACLCSYSPEGQLTAITYLDMDKKPMMVSDGYEPLRITGGIIGNQPVNVSTATQGYATLQFTYDHLKRISSITFLDKDGNKSPNSLGYAEERISYGEPGGCIARREYFDKNEKPVRIALGYHAVIYNYLLPPGLNEINNHLAEGSGPQEQLKKELGSHGGDSSRRASSRINIPVVAPPSLLTRIHYLDENKNPTKHILGHSFIKFDYDASGEPLKTTWLDAQEMPMENAWGFASLFYDRTRYLTKIICQDKMGDPVLSTGGFAIQSIEYNTDGQLKEVAFFGKEKNDLAPGPRGWAQQSYTYKLSKKGDRLLTSIAHFNQDNDKHIIPDGYHIQKMEYDDNDRLVRETFEGTQGNRLFGPTGYSSARYSYITAGGKDRLLSAEYFDPDNSPCYNKDGASKVFYEYDKDGKCTKHIVCDTEGAIGTTPWQYASIELKFNKEGREIKRTYATESGLPCYGPEQASTILRTYDDLNRPLTITYKGASDAEALTPGRYTSIAYKYGKNGLDFSVSYDGGTINPCNLNSEGYYKRSVSWGDQNRKADYIERFQDAQDNPVMARNLYATRYIKLTPDGRPNSEIFLNQKDDEVPGMHYVYPGVTPAVNRMAAMEDMSRRLYLKLPGKRMEDFSPFGLLKPGLHYGSEIAATTLMENAYPFLLDRIPQGMPEGKAQAQYNNKGQLSRLDHPYPTQWNYTREEFEYDADGNLIKRTLSSPEEKNRKKISPDKIDQELESNIKEGGERGKKSDPGRAVQEVGEKSPFGSIVPD